MKTTHNSRHQPAPSRNSTRIIPIASTPPPPASDNHTVHNNLTDGRSTDISGSQQPSSHHRISSGSRPHKHHRRHTITSSHQPHQLSIIRIRRSKNTSISTTADTPGNCHQGRQTPQHPQSQIIQTIHAIASHKPSNTVKHDNPNTAATVKTAQQASNDALAERFSGSSRISAETPPARNPENGGGNAVTNEVGGTLSTRRETDTNQDFSLVRSLFRISASAAETRGGNAVTNEVEEA